MHNYSITRLRRSERNKLLETIKAGEGTGKFIHKLQDYLTYGGKCIASLDTVYCDAMELREVTDVIGHTHIVKMTEHIDTVRKRVFFQGMCSKEFDPNEKSPINKMYSCFYVHTTKEDSADAFGEICRNNSITPTSEADLQSLYVGYEVEFKGYWTESGDFYASHVNGVPLEKPTKI